MNVDASEQREGGEPKFSTMTKEARAALPPDQLRASLIAEQCANEKTFADELKRRFAKNVEEAPLSGLNLVVEELTVADIDDPSNPGAQSQPYHVKLSIDSSAIFQDTPDDILAVKYDVTIGLLKECQLFKDPKQVSVVTRVERERAQPGGENQKKDFAILVTVSPNADLLKPTGTREEISVGRGEAVVDPRVREMIQERIFTPALRKK